jgi:hypothetical protein
MEASKSLEIACIFWQELGVVLSIEERKEK